ncbi:hypothetical protein L1887_47622 [Cichorium endivia]|nr:hypothetical protein L1887_47622 [Cichorium endivia]
MDRNIPFWSTSVLPFGREMKPRRYEAACIRSRLCTKLRASCGCHTLPAGLRTIGLSGLQIVRPDSAWSWPCQSLSQDPLRGWLETAVGTCLTQSCAPTARDRGCSLTRRAVAWCEQLANEAGEAGSSSCSDSPRGSVSLDNSDACACDVPPEVEGPCTRSSCTQAYCAAAGHRSRDSACENGLPAGVSAGHLLGSGVKLQGGTKISKNGGGQTTLHTQALISRYFALSDSGGNRRHSTQTCPTPQSLFPPQQRQAETSTEYDI